MRANSGRRYTPSDFEDWLDEAAIPDPEVEGQAAGAWADRFKDKPLVISLNARIPQEMLERWLEVDLRFRETPGFTNGTTSGTRVRAAATWRSPASASTRA